MLYMPNCYHTASILDPDGKAVDVGSKGPAGFFLIFNRAVTIRTTGIIQKCISWCQNFCFSKPGPQYGSREYTHIVKALLMQ